MRRLIGLLRDAAATRRAGRRPHPRRARRAAGPGRAHGAANGLDFTLRRPRGPADPLPAPVELAAYRIVQESLTNALKHAAPGPVTVTLDRGRRRPADGRASPARTAAGDRGPRAPGSGAGLSGCASGWRCWAARSRAGPVDDPASDRRSGGYGPNCPSRKGIPGDGRKPASEIRVLVAEDQPAVRAGLVLILRSAPGIEVVGEAADGEEAVRARPRTAAGRWC